MSVTPVSNYPLQRFFEQRADDANRMAQAIKSGNLAVAQKAYAAIVALGKSDPKGVPFVMQNREQGFQAIGTALQAGDLNGARQALAALHTIFNEPKPTPVASGAGPDAVVTLSGGQ
jgi:hypothetical protein